MLIGPAIAQTPATLPLASPRPKAGQPQGPQDSFRLSIEPQPEPNSTGVFASKARGGAHSALWRGASAGLGAAFGAAGVAAGAVLSGAVAAWQEEIPSRKLATGLATAATQTAWGSVGAVYGLPGVITSMTGALIDGLRGQNIQRQHRQFELPADQPTGQETPQKRIHLVTVVDAGESVYASQYLQQIEEAKAQSGDRLQADLRLSRSPASMAHLLGGAIWTSMLVAGPAAFGNPWIGAGTATALLTAFSGKSIHSLARGAVGLTMPSWEGRRDYEVVADQSRGFDSKVVRQVDPEPGPPVMGVPRKPESHLDETQEFLRNTLPKAPGSLKIVHIAGHGLGYRQSAGLSYGEFGELLETLDESGPLDLLVLDSCLVSNLTALSRVPSSTRYIVASEENITIGDMPETFKAALKATEGKSVDAREFGKAMVGHATSESATVPYTLALIDNARLPALGQSVSQLGQLLSKEVQQGQHGWLKPIFKEAKRFPQHSFLQRKMVGLGDLKMVAQGIHKTRGADPIGKAAAEVLENLDQAVVARQNSADYAHTGGISIQLPDSWGHRAKGMLPYHDIQDSEAPEGWKTFLATWAKPGEA